MAGVMYIFPKMVAILMDGLIPISEGCARLHEDQSIAEEILHRPGLQP
jgi:galactitol-specific phosphotransferase system IIC component